MEGECHCKPQGYVAMSGKLSRVSIGDDPGVVGVPEGL